MAKRRKPTTEELLHGGYQAPFSGLDLVKEIIFCIIVMALAFGWMILMLLIISFVTLSYLQFNIKWMLIFSTIFAVLAGIFYVVQTVKKYKKRKLVR
jgi:TRAP-type C4-dicarboxylate transport system permease small subunit